MYYFSYSFLHTINLLLLNIVSDDSSNSLLKNKSICGWFTPLV